MKTARDSMGSGTPDISPGAKLEGSFHALLSRSIDYAGLFPPAALSMRQAVAIYSDYLAGPHAWALGRFVVSINRLEEFAEAFNTQEPVVLWRISVLFGTDVAADMAATTAFNKRHGGAAVIDTLEMKSSTPVSITHAAELAGGDFLIFHEIPIEPDPSRLLSTIAGTQSRAKIRTGGVTADAFPESSALARFLERCAAARVPFKATAGLHHPIRGSYPLTGAAESPRACMHGFVNVMLAAAFARAGWGTDQLVRILAERSPSAFQFAAESASWNGHRLNRDQLHATRLEFFCSFGSCSFEDPISETQAMGWL